LKKLEDERRKSMIPSIQKILYATDLSPNSIYALRYAVNASIKHDADLIILHVFEKVDPASQIMLGLYINEQRHKEIFKEHAAEARELIEHRLNALRDQEIEDQPGFVDKVISIEVCEGFPAEVILSKADELNCDEIVMGTHSKGIIANTFLGSTAKRVLRRTRKPVLVIPLPKEEADNTSDGV
jgi:nucleotide-binding universal stress UspA family protein